MTFRGISRYHETFRIFHQWFFIFRRVLAIKPTFHDSTVVYAMPTYSHVRSQSFQVMSTYVRARTILHMRNFFRD